MTIWQIVLIASIAVLALKLAGYLVPPTIFSKPGPARVASLLSVALLAALVATNTLTSGSDIVLDARIPAVVVAGILLAFRVPFILVLVGAAVTAALLRMWLGLS